MVAGALRDVGYARIVGSHTFGDDVLQLFAPLRNGTAVEMATAHLFTATGADLDHGITPDIPVDAEPSAADKVLDRAVKALTAGA